VNKGQKKIGRGDLSLVSLLDLSVYLSTSGGKEKYRRGKSKGREMPVGVEIELLQV